MKRILITAALVFSLLNAYSQVYTTPVSYGSKNINPAVDESHIRIFPVPVRENILNIRSSKEISSIKITNIIGQDIFRSDYSNSQTQLKIILDNPQRGMYLVSIRFSDNTRIVKKIMIEGLI